MLHQQAAKVQASLRICEDSHEPNMHAYTKYEYRKRLRRSLKTCSECVIISDVREYAESTEMPRFTTRTSLRCLLTKNMI